MAEQEAWPRKSSDAHENARGTTILEECNNIGLCISNLLETASLGCYTSHQPKGLITACLRGFIAFRAKLPRRMPYSGPQKKTG
jgi:hypothetical protein